MKTLVNGCKISLVMSTLLVGLFVSATSLAATPCEGKSCYYTPPPTSTSSTPTATSKERCMIRCHSAAVNPCAGISLFPSDIASCKTAALAGSTYKSCVAACK